MDQKFIETYFPVKEISRDAEIEMSYKSAPAYIKHAKELGISEKVNREFFDPKIRNLHPWFARRPCSAARAITLASVLPPDIGKKEFLEIIGWNDKKRAYFEHRHPPLLFYVEPNKRILKNLLGEKLEECIICDPMAGGGTIPFESLRAGFNTIAVEYNPVAFIILKSTLEYPAKFGIQLAERVKEEANKFLLYAEETLNAFYPKDVEGYIFARGIKCPKCNGLIPLISNPEIGSNSYIGFYFNKSSKSFVPYVSEIKPELTHVKRGEVVCMYCNNKIKKIEAYKRWSEKHSEILDNLLNGRYMPEEILSTHLLCVRQTKRGYGVVNEEDILTFLNACKHLAEISHEFQRYLPMEKIPQENEVFDPVKSYGIKHWYHLFNPRQLLSIGVLTKYVNERLEALPTADEIGKAAMVYLSLAISRVIDYNSIVTTWKKGTIRDTLGQYARNRKISYGESYCEAIVPKRNLRWILELNASGKTQGGIIPILNYICRVLGGAGEKINIVFGDARKLSSYISKKIDLINVDPPYFDTHIYSDISEYFWQVLRLSLQKLINDDFIFRNKKMDWDLCSHHVPRKDELIVRKSQKSQKKFDELRYAKEMMEFFKESYKVLKEDGILVIWFTHKKLNAWKSIISALYGSGFFITRIWPVTSELLTRLVAKNNEGILDKTLIIIARKKSEDMKIDMHTHAFNLAKGIKEALSEIEASESELRTFLYAAAISGITAFPNDPTISDPIEYSYSQLIPKAVKIAEKLISLFKNETEAKKLIDTLYKMSKNEEDK
jgi:adenine-specific DNA methylase